MNRLDFSYNENYFPAMPVMELEVDGYSDRASVLLTALIDSGADGTMIPIDILEAVDALFEDTVHMRGVLGESELVDRYTIAIRIGSITLHGIHAVSVSTGDEAIIGRDVLNFLAMTLNGPAHMTQIEIDKA